jgi:hypothetical protein
VIAAREEELSARAYELDAKEARLESGQADGARARGTAPGSLSGHQGLLRGLRPQACHGSGAAAPAARQPHRLRPLQPAPGPLAPAAPTAAGDRAGPVVAARWAAAAAERQVLAGRWMCLAEDKKARALLERRLRSGGDDPEPFEPGAPRGGGWREGHGDLVTPAASGRTGARPFAGPRPLAARATAPRAAPPGSDAPARAPLGYEAGGPSRPRPRPHPRPAPPRPTPKLFGKKNPAGSLPIQDVSCAIIAHQVDIPLSSCCFQR